MISDPLQLRDTLNDFKQETAGSYWLEKNDLTLNFCSVPTPSGRKINASDLAILIRLFPGRCLTHLSLSSVHINVEEGTAAEEFLEALSTCRSLQLLHLNSSSLVGEDSNTMVDLGSVLARLPHLRKILVKGGDLPFYKAITPILQNPNHILDTVLLSHFSITKEEDGGKGDGMIDFLAAAARSTKLQRLKVSPFPSRGIRSIQSISQLLILLQKQQQPPGTSSSSSLRWLTLCVEPCMDLIPIAHALRDNTSLESLTIHRSWMSVPTAKKENEAEAFRDSLKDYNYTLKRLEIKHSSKAFKHDIDFYISLNRMGRAKLLMGGGTPTYNNKMELSLTSSSSSSDWIRAISHQDDPSIIYYFLSRNPFLLCRPAGVPSSSSTVRSHDCHHQLSSGPSKEASDSSNIVSPLMSIPVGVTNKKRQREEADEEESSELRNNKRKKNHRTIMEPIVHAMAYSAVFAAGYWLRGSSGCGL